jgi:hypothetical protein
MVIGRVAPAGVFPIAGTEKLVTVSPGPFWETYADAYPMNVQVPVAYWLRAQAGKAPVIQAPWGEQYRPQVYTLFGIALYNPYATGHRSTREFREWQFKRATEAVYGEPITEAEYQEAALSLPRLVQHLRIAALTLTTMIAGVLLVIYIFNFGSWYRVRRTLRGKVAVLFVCLLIFGTMVWMGWVSPYLGTYEMTSGKELVEAALIWLANVLPQNPLALGAILLAFIGPLYWIVDRQFNELDMSQLPSTVV